MLIPTLEHRMTQAAKLRGAHAQMVHAISRNFSIKDTNQIMEQLIQRCQGNLEQYIRNELLMHNHCMEIVRSLNAGNDAGSGRLDAHVTLLKDSLC